MSFKDKMEDALVALGMDLYGIIYVRVEPKDGVMPGQLAKIIFNAKGLKATTLAIYHTGEGTRLYESSPQGSIIVQPLKTTSYVLIATNPDGLHEEEMVEIKVHDGHGQGTRTWPRVIDGRNDRAAE